jgi:predicted methyltransferase
MNRSLPFFAVSFLTSAVAIGCGSSPSTPPTSASGGPAIPSAPGAVYTPATAPGADAATDAKIRQSLAGAQRTEKERARDVYRHPLETLEFFGLTDSMTVVELSPGGGWYSAVLAPVLRDKGKLFVAGGDPNGDPKSEGTKNAQELVARFQQSPQAFDKVQSIVVARDKPIVLGAPESADMVLTFRNFHNWVGGKSTDGILTAVFTVLKHGGVLGLTDHRANPGTSADPKVVGDSGYIPEDAVVDIVQKAGFKLAGKSEVNANPKDTKDYPKGVWTLPPSYELGPVDHAKYEAIGESDRMTLKFVKP